MNPFDAQVNRSYVRMHITGAVEADSAMLAPMGPRVEMGVHVLPHVFFANESLAASIAFVGLLIFRQVVRF